MLKSKTSVTQELLKERSKDKIEEEAEIKKSWTRKLSTPERINKRERTLWQYTKKILKEHFKEDIL